MWPMAAFYQKAWIAAFLKERKNDLFLLHIQTSYLEMLVDNILQWVQWVTIVSM